MNPSLAQPVGRHEGSDSESGYEDVEDDGDEPTDAPGDVRDVEMRLMEAYPALSNLDDAVRSWAPTGWELWQWEARLSAAVWRYAKQKGWCGILRKTYVEGRPALFRGLPWRNVLDRHLVELMEAKVAAVDNARAAFEARLRLSVVVHLETVRWVGGLSPRGHLVGFLVRNHAGD